MTMTHLSHFGLTEAIKTNDAIILEGTLAACKRMAAAHGCEVTEEVKSPETTRVVRYWIKTSDGRFGGGIHIRPDGWALVMPIAIWESE